MSKKGFTLIELLTVIIMLAVILVISVPALTNIINNARLNSFIADEKMMIWAAKNYLNLNDNHLPANIGDTIEIKLSDLQAGDFVDDIQNPFDSNDTCDGYILVTKVDNNKYDYSPYLKCLNNYKADSYITDGLEVYWKFDGNAYDYTPNEEHGTIHNVDAIDDRFGVSNKALNFDGPSNYIDTNYDYSLNNNGDTTFSLWVKFSTIDTAGKVKNIFGKNSWEYLLSQVDEKIYFSVWNSPGSYAVRLVSNVNIQIDKWYNIVITYNSSEKTMSLYINGILDSFSPVSSSFIDKSESMKIGRGYPDTGAASSTFFVGILDNFCIYNRTWTASEVKLNYDVGNLINI